MVCPNCQSTDIVELQNQHFCINCGRLIELVTKKRGPGRPKAQRLDRPSPLTIQIAVTKASLDKNSTESADEEVIAISPESTIDEAIEPETTIPETADNESISREDVAIEPPKISHSFHQAPQAKLPAEVALSAEIKARKRLQDIVPNKEVEVDKNDQKPASEAISLPKTRIPLPQIISAAWSEPWQGGPARILIVAAIIAAATAGGITSLFLNHVKNLTQAASIFGGLSLAVAVALLFGVANTERAAFALRRYDHRPIPRSWLFGGALAVIFRQSVVVLGGIVDIGLIAVLSILIAKYLPSFMSQPFCAYVLVLAYFLLTLLALAVWVKTGIASAGVELGRMTALEGLKFGWRSLWRHPELMGSRLVAILWVVSSLAGIVAVAWGLHLVFAQYDYWITIISATLITFTAVLLGNFGAVGWRHSTYREIVIIDEAPDAIALLSGHHNGAPSKQAQYLYIITIFLLLIIGFGVIAKSLF